jgi:hypothetical protein
VAADSRAEGSHTDGVVEELAVDGGPVVEEVGDGAVEQAPVVDARTGLQMPEDVEPGMLAPEVRGDLRSLSKHQADSAARHLVMAGRLVDTDPELALRYAREARRMAARIGVVREAVGIAAYRAGEWAESLTELRAARRLTGDSSHLPLMADCERAMGRPERALRVVQSDEAGQLDEAGRVELRMVEAGVRRDLGEMEAALAVLKGAGLDRSRLLPWSARLWYAYADTLLAAGRGEEAQEWFVAVAAVDTDGETDVDERLVELGVLESLEEVSEEASEEAAEDLPEAPAAEVVDEVPAEVEVVVPVGLFVEGAVAEDEEPATEVEPAVPGVVLFQEPPAEVRPTTLPEPTDNSAD